MKITVLGCGALGKLWLSALARRGHQVQGWLRLPQPDCSVHLITPQGLTYQRQLPANDPELLAQSDLLLVTLKAWQIANALPPLLPRLSPHCTLLLLHNGMGAIDELRTLPRQPCCRGARRTPRAEKGIPSGTSPGGSPISARSMRRGNPAARWPTPCTGPCPTWPGTTIFSPRCGISWR